MGGEKDYSPNEMRSRMMNPQDSMGQAAMDNRANQLNPNHEESKEDK